MVRGINRTRIFPTESLNFVPRFLLKLPCLKMNRRPLGNLLSMFFRGDVPLTALLSKFFTVSLTMNLKSSTTAKEEVHTANFLTFISEVL